MNEEHIRGLHQQMRELKEHWWHHHDEPDPPPYLAVVFRDIGPINIDCAAFGTMTIAAHKRFPNAPLRGITIPADEDPPGAILLWVTMSAVHDRVELPGEHKLPPPDVPIEQIIFNVEGWARAIDTPGATTMEEAIEAVGGREALPPHGDLEADFRNNPASDVRETMTTYYVVTGPLGTPEWQRATSMFHKDDGGIIVWQEPLVNDSENAPEAADEDTLIQVMVPFVTREALA